MAAIPRTSLSAGLVIRQVLLDSEALDGMVNAIFPVAATVEEARLPYIYYRRTSFEGQQVKGSVGPNSVLIEVNCCAETYDQALDIAEVVLESLNGAQCTAEGLRMRSCYLTDSDEFWEDDAYVQRLIFNVKIS